VVIGVKMPTATGLTLLLILMGVVSACATTQAAPPRTVPPAGELIAVQIEVHEAPG